MSFLLCDVQVAGKRVDVRLLDDRIDAIGVDLDPRGAEVVPGRGGALLPGLTDHHLHLLAMAADLESVRFTPSAVGDGDGLRSDERRVGKEGVSTCRTGWSHSH